MGRQSAVSLVFVTYRSSEVVADAVASFRAESEASGFDCEIVLVDHSEDLEEVRRLGALEPDVVVAQENRGYAAGVNTGVARAAGSTLIVANPDVVFGKGALEALIDATEVAGGNQSVDGRGVIVGPQFTLAGWALPPAEPQSPLSEICRRMRTYGTTAWRWQLRRWLREWRRVWEATRPVEVATLSGALLVFSRAVYERVGPWDEEYFLYFEETDWLARARDLGIGCRVVPTARVEHAWGHAATPAKQEARFEASRRRFLERLPWWRAWLGRIVPAMPARGWRPRRSSWPPTAVPPDVEWLVSPSPWAMPAARHEGDEEIGTAVADFLEAAPVDEVTVLAVDAAEGEVVGLWRVRGGVGG